MRHHAPSSFVICDTRAMDSDTTAGPLYFYALNSQATVEASPSKSDCKFHKKSFPI